MGWWCRSENAIVSQYFGGQFVKTSHWFAVDDFHLFTRTHSRNTMTYHEILSFNEERHRSAALAIF